MNLRPLDLRPALRGLALAAALALAGCAANRAIGPQDAMPSKEVLAERFHLVSPDADTVPLPPLDWWKAFEDPQLDHWIELGLADSPSLKEAAARVRQAQAIFDTARAAQAPQVGVAASIDQERITSNGIFPYPIAGLVTTDDTVGFSGSFEFDLWGRLAARSDAARLLAQASETDRAQTRVRLAGAIAHAYFELAREQQTQRVLVELEIERSKMLELVRQRVQAGFDTQVDRRLAEVPVPEIRVDIERTAEQIELARHSLAILAGQAPQAAAAVQARLPSAERLAPPTRLPVDLLARRADIAGAQTRVLASLRSVDAARADFYPNVNLTALVGLEALSVNELLQRSSQTWQIEPAVHLPIFDGGMLRSNLRKASAQTDEAVAAYNQTVLQAVGEVADDLTSIASVQRQRAQQTEATSVAQAASDLADTRYAAGLGNLLAVLTAQASVLTHQKALVDLDARAAALDVSLALALGGGYGAAEAKVAQADRK